MDRVRVLPTNPQIPVIKSFMAFQATLGAPD
jgi:hypothetical protein